MEEEKNEHTNRMKKMEAEMEQVFEMKVKEKMGKLNELEQDVCKVQFFFLSLFRSCFLFSFLLPVLIGNYWLIDFSLSIF